jgi:sugar phosphate isomerase/epimerase
MTTLKVYKALWGMEGSLDHQLDRIAEAGYDGIESPVPADGIGAFRSAYESRGLSYIGMLFVQTADELARGLGSAADAGCRKVTVHSGKDAFSFDEGCRYFEGAIAAEKAAGIPVGHETHRGRLLFTPWSTAEYLRKFPDLKIVADFSHWTNVCERLLDDQADALALAAERTLHIHGRIGHEQGAQVSDPRGPEFAGHVAKFEGWWDMIRDAAIKRGDAEITFDPEFGPPTYLQTLPYTQQPVASLWDVCLWTANRVRTRWS